jgi:hypothetical protein
VHVSTSRLLSFSILALLASTACDARKSILDPNSIVRTALGDDLQDPMKLGAVTFRANPSMATAATAYVECSGVVAALQVVYDAPSVDNGRTQRLPTSSCPAEVNLLGLLPSEPYHTRVIAWGKNDHDESVVHGPILTTPSLPAALPRVTTQMLGTAYPGLTVLTVFSLNSRVPSYALIVDSIGRIRWYLADSTHSLFNLQPQPNGHYALATTPSTRISGIDELDIAGHRLRLWTARGGYATDVHELRLLNPGTALLLGGAGGRRDLTAYGGSSTALLEWQLLERVDSLGRLDFLWSASDHLGISEIDPSIPLNTPIVDWTHGNAIEVDNDSNYLVSFRNLSEVTKINSRTGEVIWRWGGLKNEFQFIGDTLKFAFQHAVRRLANGNYILFDNGNTHKPPFSRAVEYRLDQRAKTATLVWSYRPRPDIFSGFFGFAQRLANGNTLVTFGPQGSVHEVSASGHLVWKLTAPSGYAVYRAYRIRSLYDPVLVDESRTGARLLFP